GMHAASEKLPLQGLSDRRFAGTGKAGEPDHGSAMTKVCWTFVRSDLSLGPKDILALGNRSIGVGAAENDAAAANRAVIGEDKPAQIGHPIVIIEHERCSRWQG